MMMMTAWMMKMTRMTMMMKMMMTAMTMMKMRMMTTARTMMVMTIMMMMTNMMMTARMTNIVRAIVDCDYEARDEHVAYTTAPKYSRSSALICYRSCTISWATRRTSLRCEVAMLECEGLEREVTRKRKVKVY